MTTQTSTAPRRLHHHGAIGLLGFLGLCGLLAAASAPTACTFCEESPCPKGFSLSGWCTTTDSCTSERHIPSCTSSCGLYSGETLTIPIGNLVGNPEVEGWDLLVGLSARCNNLPVATIGGIPGSQHELPDESERPASVYYHWEAPPQPGQMLELRYEGTDCGNNGLLLTLIDGTCELEHPQSYCPG
ncbi:MAG: hypothetical protein HOV80_18530 [Polyangiaceae bacterium]|nr:hypothetical protein [Polyangiaceae bacterium]